MRLRSVLNFGKYKGKKVSEVLKTDPTYLQWAINNTNSFPNQELIDELNKKGLEVKPRGIINDEGNKAQKRKVKRNMRGQEEFKHRRKKKTKS